METSDLEELMTIFNVSGSGKLSSAEFQFCWTEWIKKVTRPSSALVVVDVQNDFISGSLAIKNCPAGQNGEEVVPPINRLLDTVPFTMHCYSLDWHPADHISFIDNVKMRKLSPESKVLMPVLSLLTSPSVSRSPTPRGARCTTR